jgi:predicted Zn-dependent peptidase
MAAKAVDRKKAPLILEPVAFDLRLPVCQKSVLSNGVTVYHLDMGTEDTLQLNWVFYAGNWHETQKGQAAATNFLLKNGTSSKDAYAINEHFEYYGSYLNRACYNETAEISLHCLNHHLPHLLPEVAELMTDAVFPEEELAIYRQNAVQRLKVNLLKSDFVAGRLIDAQLFGVQHPYGRYMMPEDYDGLQRSSLTEFYRHYYQQGHCLIFAAGKLPKDLLQQLEDHFGKLPLQPAVKDQFGQPTAVQPAAEKKLHVTNDPNGVQAAIRLARPFPGRHHPDFQKALILNNLFGGFFGSRLMANIREDKGYTYGIYSYLLNHLRECGWLVSTEAGREVSEATVREIHVEMARLREKAVDEEELQMTRNYMIGSILSDLDGPFQVIGRWRHLILNGLDEDYFYKGLELIRSTTALELQQLAQHYLNPEDFYEVVVV